jgi:hypothetical protein
MKNILSGAVAATVVVVGVFFFVSTIFGATSTSITSQVVVGSAVPSVTGISVNGGAAINLTAGGTTNISVNGTLTDSNGCGEITGGTTTILLYRSGVTSSSCQNSSGGAVTSLNCYIATAFTASSTCSGGTTNTTTTFAVQYFAQATDASSSFSSQNWLATLIFRTADNTTGTADSAGVTLNTLLGLGITTSSINYGILSASSTSGSTDQMVTSTNAGNSSTSLQLYALGTLTSGSNSISTSSQSYSTSTFTYPGTSTALSASAATVNGFLLTAPTSSSNVAQLTYWGINVPNGSASGTYTGTNVFQALFHS